MSKPPLKQARNQNAIEAAILNRVLDRDWTLNRRGPLRNHVMRFSWPKCLENVRNDHIAWCPWAFKASTFGITWWCWFPIPASVLSHPDGSERQSARPFLHVLRPQVLARAFSHNFCDLRWNIASNCDFELRFPSWKPALFAGVLVIWLALAMPVASDLRLRFVWCTKAGPETSKLPKVVRRGCKWYCDVCGPKACCTGAKRLYRGAWGLHLVLYRCQGHPPTLTGPKFVNILASRKHCDLKTRKRCDFYSAAQKITSDFSAISSAIFWRFFCDFCGKTCDLVFCDLKTQRFFCDCDFLGPQVCQHVVGQLMTSVSFGPPCARCGMPQGGMDGRRGGWRLSR